MITLPKLLGGLGVRDSQVANTTLLGKMIWDILHSPEKHWVHVLKEKYLRGGILYPLSWLEIRIILYLEKFSKSLG